MLALYSNYPSTTITCDSPVSMTYKADTTLALNAALALKADKAQEAWITPTLVNGWVNYSALGGETVGFYKDSLGIVRLRGVINTGASGTVVFTLPLGYRPLAAKYYICACSGASVGRVDVGTGGTVTIAAFTGWLSLDSISFKAV